MKREISSLFSNLRFYILVFAVLLSVVEYFIAQQVTESRGMFVHTILNWYALTSVIFLYFTLLAGPFAKITRFSWRGKYVFARRAIGVSAFYFALLHVRYTFFDILGGVSGIISLPPVLLFPVLLGVLSLIILLLMAATAFDKAVNILTFPRWKRLHQLVYLVGVALFFHASLLGSHFVNKTGLIPILYYAATVLLVGVHGYGLYKKRQFLKSQTKQRTL